jgi:hypothetical protein
MNAGTYPAPDLWTTVWAPILVAVVTFVIAASLTWLARRIFVIQPHRVWTLTLTGPDEWELQYVGKRRIYDAYVQVADQEGNAIEAKFVFADLINLSPKAKMTVPRLHDGLCLHLSWMDRERFQADQRVSDVEKSYRLHSVPMLPRPRSWNDR